jgi:hypothetical protein
MITEKQKYYGILVAIPLALALLYSWSISGTLKTITRVRQLEEDLTRMDRVSTGLATARAELERVERVIKRNEINDTLDILFSRLTRYCRERGVLLRDYSSMHVAVRQNYHCYTRVITFEGEFQELLGLVDHVENEGENQLQAISFEVIPARGKVAAGLRLKLYVQFISW